MCVSFDSSQYSEIIIDLLISIHTSIQQQHNINYILLVYLSQPIGNIVWNLSHNFVIFVVVVDEHKIYADSHSIVCRRYL